MDNETTSSASGNGGRIDEGVLEARKRARVWLNVTLWVLAVILTLASVVYQRATGPTHPVNGRVEISGETIKYSLLRSWPGSEDARLEMKCSPNVSGSIFWKRFRTADEFIEDRMEHDQQKLTAKLPHQPPAGKLEYYIVLRGAEGEIQLPANNRSVVIRFRGDVPLWVMIPHILLMFSSMLLAMRLLLEVIKPMGYLRVLSWWTISTLFAGGFIFGPLVQKYSFGAFWTGFPLGLDLTDNKTLIALIGWIIAIWFIHFAKGLPESRRRLAALLASLLMLVIFMIPHSMLGSELDYSKVEQGVDPVHAVGSG